MYIHELPLQTFDARPFFNVIMHTMHIGYTYREVFSLSDTILVTEELKNYFRPIHLVTLSVIVHNYICKEMIEHGKTVPHQMHAH